MESRKGGLFPYGIRVSHIALTSKLEKKRGERDHIRFRIRFQQGIHKNSRITYKAHFTQCFDDLIKRDDIRNQIDFDHGLDESFRSHHIVLLTVSMNQSTVRNFARVYTHFQHHLRNMHGY